MDTTPLEFSKDGEFVVHSSHDGVIKVWETATNTLKNEYKPSSHLSATCSCLSWCPKIREVSYFFLKIDLVNITVELRLTK